MTEEATSAQAVLVARFSEHKSAALAAAELMNAGFPESDLKVVFEEEQMAAPVTNSSLRSAFRRALSMVRGRKTRQAEMPSWQKVLSVDTGATLTLHTRDQQSDARAILSQHGAEFA